MADPPFGAFLPPPNRNPLADLLSVGRIPVQQARGSGTWGDMPGLMGPPSPAHPLSFRGLGETAWNMLAPPEILESVDPILRSRTWGELLPPLASATIAAAGFVPVGGPAAKGARTAAKVDELASGMGMSTQRFYRGGELPASGEYGGAHFSRDREYAQGVADRNWQGQAKPEMREFRLDLSKTFPDRGPVTASTYARLVGAADPKLAADMVDMIAPGKSVEWFQGFARHQPDMVVADNGRLIRQAIEVSSTNPVGVFTRAGFDALDSGRDVRKLTGDGIRLTEAAFDPANKSSRNILASMLFGLPAFGALTIPPPPERQEY